MAIITEAEDIDTISYDVPGMTGTTVTSITINGVPHAVGLPVSGPATLQTFFNALFVTLGFRAVCEVVAGLDFRLYWGPPTLIINSIVINTGAGSNTYIPTQMHLGWLRDYDPASMATILETQTIKAPVAPITLNYCTCPCQCDFEEKVFAGSSESDGYKSDYKSYLFKKYLSGDSYTLALYKNGSVTPLTINTGIADTYAFGALSRNGVVDSNYSGFVIQWYRVFNLYGYGRYQIKGTETKFGVTTTYESHVFKLTAFGYPIAKGTVKIETVQNGYIESDDIDMTGFNWPQMVRTDGKLFKGIPKLVQDNYQDTGRVVRQIQDQVLDEWQLELRPVPAEIANYLAYNASMANQMLISDYNVNPEVYKQKDLMITEIQEFKTWAQNASIRSTFKCASRVQNILKRNFV